MPLDTHTWVSIPGSSGHKSPSIPKWTPPHRVVPAARPIFAQNPNEVSMTKVVAPVATGLGDLLCLALEELLG